MGGVGKTRLAVQVAAELLATFADGAWLCELAAAADADTLAQVVASTLGVVQRAGRSLEQSIVEFLRSSRLLVVLDNCEHLLEASGRLVAAILAGCPEVRVLATSREALAVAGEQVWPLHSLELPDPGSGWEAAAESASVRLFCERGGGRPSRFRPVGGECGRGGRGVPAAGWDPAGHRVGRRPGGGHDTGRGRRAAG